MDSQRAPDVEVYLASPETWAGHPRWRDLLASLSREEKSLAAQLLREEDARLHQLGRGLLRYLLSQRGEWAPADWVIGVGSGGKPALVGSPLVPPLDFNIAHTKGLVAIALSTVGEVGVDVENVLRDDVSLHRAARSFSPGEQGEFKALSGPSQREKFFELWTLKEAFIKARGTGLATPLADIAFKWDAAGTPSLASSPGSVDETGNWHFQLWREYEPHIVAVAVHSSTRPTMAVRHIVPESDW